MTKKQIHGRFGGKHKGQLGVQSRPLDVHRWSDYPELRACLGELVTELQASEERKRARSHRGDNQFRDAVRCIVLDLYVAWTADPATEIGVALGKDSFGKGTRYDALFITYNSFRPAIRALIARGYVEELRKGFNDPRSGKGRVTRIRAAPKLIALLTGRAQLTTAQVGFRADETAAEVVILRDSKKNPIPYNDTAATRLMRSDIERLNAALASHWIDLYLPDSRMAELNARMALDHRTGERETFCIDLSAKRLCRIFNNGDWKQGGRFYGGWWQNVPKEYRIYITIDEKHTTELDYSGMHPALMYAEVRARLDGDPYEVGAPTVPRDIVKRAFNKLVNASGRTVPTPDFDAESFGLSWRKLLELVKTRHQPIARLLGTGYGLRLQNRDAMIANRIMQHFIRMGYTCLPVHDSFIVHHGLKDELRAVMEDEFRREVGTAIGTKAKLDVIETDVALTATAIDAVPAIEEHFSAMNEYRAYESRLQDWWNILVRSKGS